jgi:FkbM family methyltransferase
MKQVTAKPPGLAAFPFYVHEQGDAFISNRIAETGMWEPFESTMMLGLLSPSDQFIDIGANIGWYAVSAAVRVGSAGHVVAFEPDLSNFALLEANIRQNRSSSITPLRCALGAARGKATLRASGTNKGDQRVREFEATVEGTQSGDSVSIETLDEVLEAMPLFDLDKLRIIKIDVQGFEAEVLKGSARLLSRLPQRAIIFLEFEPSLLRDNSQTACQEVIELIASLDRDVFQICRPLRRLRKMEASDLRGLAASKDASADLIIVHRSQREALRSTLPLIPRLLSRDLF